MRPNPTLGSVRVFGMVILGMRSTSAWPRQVTLRPTFIDANDVALDYGNFPFSRTFSQYFYAAVADGYEDAGFFRVRPAT